LRKNKIIYVGLTLDFYHHGIANIIDQAGRYGDILIGLLTDEAISEHKKLPIFNYTQREKICYTLNKVYKVVPQKEWDYSVNIKKYKPDFFIHGTDWNYDEELKNIKKNTINELKSYGGKLIEIDYSDEISSSLLRKNFLSNYSQKDYKNNILDRLLHSKKIIRGIESHSPLSSLIAEKVVYKSNNIFKSFDCLWSSSLTDSTLNALPDIEVLDISRRLDNVKNIANISSKPIIFDADTGGQLEHFKINISLMANSNISAIIIEDKKGLKKNSLLGTDVFQQQEDTDLFSQKIQEGKSILKNMNSSMKIFARIESFILGKDIKDAIARANAYVNSGSDGIMIHSRKEDPSEIFQFAKEFRILYPNIPLISVPTSYNSTHEDELHAVGFNIVIYANHMLRASYKSMEQVAHDILKYGRTHEIELSLLSIKEILKLIPGTD